MSNLPKAFHRFGVFYLLFLLAACSSRDLAYHELQTAVPDALQRVGKLSRPPDCPEYEFTLLGWTNEGSNLLFGYCLHMGVNGLLVFDLKNGKQVEYNIPGRPWFDNDDIDVNGLGQIAYVVHLSDPLEIESEGYFEIYDPNRNTFRRSPSFQFFSSLGDLDLSPEGNRIVFADEERIEVMNILSGEREVIFQPEPPSKYREVGYRPIEWSDDGQKIAFVMYYGYLTEHYEVGVIRLSDGEHSRIYESDFPVWDISWSPDSRLLAIDQFEGIALTDPEKNCTVGQVPVDVYESAWSPEGHEIAIMTFDLGLGEIILLDVKEAFGASLGDLTCE